MVIPPETGEDEELLKAILPLTDVMSTGYHAAVSAAVAPGSTAAIVGDGAVGLCSVLASKSLGAERIIIWGHHYERLQIAKSFGATDIVTSRGEDAINMVRKITCGGILHVMECVGAKSAMDTAIAITRPGGTIGYVGVLHGSSQDLNLFRLFINNINLSGGVAPARAYIPKLLEDVIAGKLDASPVLDLTVALDDVPKGYQAMDDRKALKVMVKV